jgi:hypothetical protein
VIELASGRRGVVKHGVRDDATGQQVYRVELVTGQEVIRSADELAIDKLPAVK